jgi:hypothetical protein
MWAKERNWYITITHNRCSGSDAAPNNIHTIALLRLINIKLLKLGTPISSETAGSPLCALSTSCLVGATRSCMQRLEQSKSAVDMTFTTRCMKVFMAGVVSRAPRRSAPPGKSRWSTSKVMKLTNKVRTARMVTKFRIVSRLVCRSNSLAHTPRIQASSFVSAPALSAEKSLSAWKSPRYAVLQCIPMTDGDSLAAFLIL